MGSEVMKKIRSSRDFLKKPYARILIPSEDGTYAAEMLEFPGCFSQGNTPQEAMENLDDAAEAWIEAAIEQNQEIPEPLATYGYSGKISLRIPRSVHKKAAHFAQKDDVSLNQFFASAIAARVGAEEICDRLIERLEGRLTSAEYTLRTMQVTGSFVAGTVQFALPTEFPGVHVESPDQATTGREFQPLRVVSNG